MTATRHLVTVWDPSRGDDTMQVHLQLLLAARQREDVMRRAQSLPRAERGEDDVYVWWGKIRSPNRQQPMAHLPEILAIDDLLNSPEAPPEVHLYLTDYRSLYVAHVGEVTAADVREEEDEPDRYVAGVYRGAQCDCWFRLWDIRRLVHDDTLGVIDELRKLRNTHYHDKPVSIYGGMIDLPLVVRRDDGARFFDPEVRRLYIDGRSWAEFDAERTGLGTIERDLRENMLGDDAWKRLDPAARTFAATAEKIFRDHRDDSAFDFSPVLVNFAKAVEVQANDLLRRAAGALPPAQRRANVEGRSADLAHDGPWSLGQLARIVGEDQAMNSALKRLLHQGEWFTASLPPIMRHLAELRNPAAHSTKVGREDARRTRDAMVGVGSVGTLVELGRVRLR
jgi:hypothetical protein